jgi:hypothetical protein
MGVCVCTGVKFEDELPEMEDADGGRCVNAEDHGHCGLDRLVVRGEDPSGGTFELARNSC